MDKKIKLLSTRQVSEYLGLSVRTVQRLSELGKIKAVKIGSYWKYSEEDINKYLIFGTNFSKEPARKSNDFQERRVYPRINSNFKCNYSINLSPFKEINCVGTVKNMSIGGILLISQDEFINGIEIDDPVDLDFKFVSKGNEVNIKTAGRIVRKDANRFGIKFRDIKEEDRIKIVQYIG